MRPTFCLVEKRRWKKQQTFIHEKTENLCKKHSLSHNIGAIETILQRRYDKHSVKCTYKEPGKNGRRWTYEEEKRTVDLCKNSYERISTTRIAFERAIVLVNEKPNAI